MAKIELKNVTMDYGKGIKGLDNVDLTINDHEFLVLLGPSGCGKSTMLRVIAGLLHQTDGQVLFDDQDVTGLDARERNVSMVFQNYALYPHLNVFKNIAFPLGNIKKITKEEITARVEEVAKVLDIEDILNRRPRELSGGQRQRVALGRAMVRNPVVFLFDEPLSNLDTAMRQELREVIADLHRRLNTTFVYVTHDQAEAMRLGDRVAVMDEGKIIQLGNPQEVYNEPNCVYSAGFVGSPKMNFFASRFIKKEANWAVKIMGNEFGIPTGRVPFPGDDPAVSDGGRVISGIRPEDLRLEPVEGAADVSFAANVVKTVPMGAGLHAELETNGTHFMAVFQNHTDVAAGSEVTLHVDPTTIHLFDPETEKTLIRYQH